MRSEGFVRRMAGAIVVLCKIDGRRKRERELGTEKIKIIIELEQTNADVVAICSWELEALAVEKENVRSARYVPANDPLTRTVEYKMTDIEYSTVPVVAEGTTHPRNQSWRATVSPSSVFPLCAGLKLRREIVELSKPARFEKSRDMVQLVKPNYRARSAGVEHWTERYTGRRTERSRWSMQGRGGYRLGVCDVRGDLAVLRHVGPPEGWVSMLHMVSHAVRVMLLRVGLRCGLHMMLRYR